MRSSNMNSRVAEPVLSADAHCEIEIESVLRIRPLLRKEREDAVMLEPLLAARNEDLGTVVLNPLHPSLTSPLAASSLRNRADSDSTSNNVPVKYHFNNVLPDTTNQDKLYYTLGHPIASETMKSLKSAVASRSHGARKTKTHLLVCMGVANSGKTYTCFGGTTIPKRRASQDGLVPRLMDSLFSQSKHNTNSNSKGFAIQISMIQVTQPAGSKGIDSNACQLHDPLAFAKSKNMDTSPKRKANMTVRNMAARFERAIPSPGGRTTPKGKSAEANTELDAESPKVAIESARDATQAREILQNGLSASEKISKGNSNFHLFVTMQPVLDGNKHGDKIVVLDMAGLEKEKRGSGTRKNDNVSSLNQAATAAVLRCLRVMTHNVNTKSGRTSLVDGTSSDDEVSEISFVSQTKDTSKKQLKPVPFRQHKVSMLLSPLFTKSSSVKVKILLSAYPGHADLHQKRMLMQDLELLHGSSLLPSQSPKVKRGSAKLESRTTSDTVQEDDESSVASIDNQITKKTTMAAKRSHKLPSVVSRAEGSKVTQQFAPKISRHYSVVTSKALRVEKIENRLPSTSSEIPRVHPSAPVLSETGTPRVMISDFPGVDLPACITKNSRSRLSNATPKNLCSDPEVPTEKNNFEAFDEMNERNLFADPEKETDVNSKCAYGTSSEHLVIENSFPHGSSSSTRDAEEKGRNSHFVLPTLKAVSNSSSPAHKACEAMVTSKDENAANSQPPKDEEISNLKKKLKESLQEKQALERICAQLEKENAELKNEAREAGRKVLQRNWTDQDEEEFLDSRRLRREAQNLIKAPIQEHLEKVNYIYGIKNQWCMTNKQHFSLQLPNQFQRAPALDIRDKVKKQGEQENKLDNEEENQPPPICQTRSEDPSCALKGTRLSYEEAKPRKSLTLLPQKQAVQRSAALTGLKRLTAWRD